MTDALPEGWAVLREWLPADLNEPARQHGFFQRARGLQDAECWLRLILMHVGGGLSLEQTVMRARELGWRRSVPLRYSSDCARLKVGFKS